MMVWKYFLHSTTTTNNVLQTPDWHNTSINLGMLNTSICKHLSEISYRSHSHIHKQASQHSADRHISIYRVGIVSNTPSTASPSPPCPWCWGCTCGGWRGHTPSWRACPPPRSQTGTRWLDSSWNWNVSSLFSIYNIPTWFEFQCFWYYITSLTCIYKISFIVKKWSLGTWGLW